MKNKKNIEYGTKFQCLAYLKPYWHWIVFNILLSFASAGVDIGSGYFIKKVIDLAIQRDLDKIFKMTIFIIFFITLGAQVKFLLQYTLGWFTSHIIFDIRSNAMEAINKISYANIEKHHSGDMISRLSNDIFLIQHFFNTNFVDIFYQPLLMIGTLIYLTIISWQLALVSFMFIILSLYFVKRYSQPIGTFSKDIQIGHAKVNAIVQDSVGGIAMIKAYNLESHIFFRFNQTIDQLYDSYLKKNKRSALLSPLQFLIVVIPLICSISLGGFLALKGEITLGSFFAFIFLLKYLSDPLTVIPDLITELRSVSAGVSRILELVNIKKERKDGKVYSLSPEDEQIIEFDNVYFSYVDNVNVLNGLSFKISKNKMVAIVGKSGSGKSTIIRLICTYYLPQQGNIVLYGHNYDTWSLEGIRSQISLVAQDSYLFPGTIFENIMYGKPLANMEDVIKAAQTANADEFIKSFTEGYQTLVGERGGRLSGGQKQRIAIARAILKNTPILIFDEPTSALDEESELLIMKALERIRHKKTVIMVTHRLSTIRLADHIIVLEDGHIVEDGTHESLYKKQGNYYELYQKQFE